MNEGEHYLNYCILMVTSYYGDLCEPLKSLLVTGQFFWKLIPTINQLTLNIVVAGVIVVGEDMTEALETPGSI